AVASMSWPSGNDAQFNRLTKPRKPSIHRPSGRIPHQIHPLVFLMSQNFVLAKNTSLPNRISHAKFMILLSLLNNPDIAPTAVTELKKMHSTAITDDSYALLVP
ncbi:MAG: hypothetical protein NTV56_19585, partial [Alphaproteobacteria bacterium]|nr:hypothetical protein [Alphaproteobacteria bacterium]